MRQIESSAEFGALVKAFKKKWPRVQTNCTLLPAEVQAFAARGSLNVWECEEALCFLARESDCSRLYYYMKQDAALLELEDWERPVVLDCVFRGDEESALKKCGIHAWSARGFVPYKRNRRMECRKENFRPPLDEEEQERRYPVIPLKAEDYRQASMLWRGSLDYLSASFWNREEFAAACDRGELLGIRLADEKLGAVIVVLPRGKTSFMEHLVVNRELRGLGMGRTAFCGASACLFFAHGAEKINFWVEETNLHAIAIYQKMGYDYDGTICRQFLLSGKEKSLQL